MQNDGRNLLTNSRMQTAKTCLRRHYLAYELGIRKTQTSQPLRFGSNFHQGLDLLAQGATIDAVCSVVSANYADVPAWVQSDEDRMEWDVECEVCIRLLIGYQWRWSQADVEIVATEQVFNIPIINPRTGASAKIFRLAGKIDKIIRVGGRLAVMEHKTAGHDISPEADYWRRLRIDQQISLYVIASRSLGYEIETVIYDVVRKPSIRPKKLSKGDCESFFHTQKYFDEAFKIEPTGGDVVRVNGFAVKMEPLAKSFTIRETPSMFGARLAADIFENFTTYFQRQEIARLDRDLQEFYAELWQMQEMLRNCQRNGHWFKNTSACLAPYRCEFADICLSNRDVSQEIPQGFTRLDYVHPELKEEVRV